MRQLAESTPGGWAGVAMKYGPAWLVVGVLLFYLTGAWDTNLGAISQATQQIRTEHMQMGTYLRAICVGVNRDETWRCGDIAGQGR